MDDPRVPVLLHQLALAYDQRSWHGPNLRGSLRGLSLDAASYRPQPGRHSIWEIVVHCAYWKYRVCRLLLPTSTRSFSLKGSDWFPRPTERTESAWKQDLLLLEEWHEQLRAAMSARSRSNWRCGPEAANSPSSSWSPELWLTTFTMPVRSGCCGACTAPRRRRRSPPGRKRSP